jgi:hypothetical protein
MRRSSSRLWWWEWGGEMVMMDEMEQVKVEYSSVMLVLPPVGGEI